MFVYILESERNGRYYVGVTSNVKKRLDMHNSGQSKSTAPYAPYALKRVEKYSTSSEAYLREKFLKSKKSSKIIKLIVESSPDALAEQEAGIPISR